MRKAAILFAIIILGLTCLDCNRSEITETVKRETSTTEEPESTTKAEREAIQPAYIWSVAAGKNCIIAIDDTGRAVVSAYEAATDLNELMTWDNLREVSAGGYLKEVVVGLKNDGSIVSYGKDLNKYQWKDIVSITVGSSAVLGLKSDGTVVYDGIEINRDLIRTFNSWTDIVQLAAGEEYYVGLKSDGTVAATGNNTFGQCEVEEWKDVVMVAAGRNHSVGLRSNGTVISAGVSFLGQCDVAEWEQIVFVAAGNDFTIGVKNDGTVVTTGYNIDARCAGIENWNDIAYVSVGDGVVAGITKEGKILTAGYFSSNYDVSGFRDIVVPNGFDIDFSKQLATVERKSSDLAVKSFDFYGKNELIYIEPENGFIKAESFSIEVPEEIAAKICYTKNEDEIIVYLKTDIDYWYNTKNNCIEYAFPVVSYIGKRTDITGLFTFGRPEYVIGDSHIYDEVENYFHTVLRAVSNLAGTEYEYNNEKFIGTDGLILGLDKMADLYRMYKDEIAVEEYTYYVAAPPSDAQLSWTENAYDYNIAIEWFKTSAEILEQ